MTKIVAITTLLGAATLPALCYYLDKINGDDEDNKFINNCKQVVTGSLISIIGGITSYCVANLLTSIEVPDFLIFGGWIYLTIPSYFVFLHLKHKKE